MPKLIDNSSYGGGPFADMHPGEVRSFTFRNGITKTIRRTNRPFQFDWHDASNEELAAKGSPVRWVPEANGAFFKAVDSRFDARFRK